MVANVITLIQGHPIANPEESKKSLKPWRYVPYRIYSSAPRNYDSLENASSFSVGIRRHIWQWARTRNNCVFELPRYGLLRSVFHGDASIAWQTSYGFELGRNRFCVAQVPACDGLQVQWHLLATWQLTDCDTVQPAKDYRGSSKCAASKEKRCFRISPKALF